MLLGEATTRLVWKNTWEIFFLCEKEGEKRCEILVKMKIVSKSWDCMQELAYKKISTEVMLVRKFYVNLMKWFFGGYRGILMRNQICNKFLRNVFMLIEYWMFQMLNAFILSKVYCINQLYYEDLHEFWLNTFLGFEST